MQSSARRSSCFIADDDDDDDGAGASSSGSFNASNSALSRSMMMFGFRSFSGKAGVSSPRFGRHYEARCEYRMSHFLQTCAFCRKSIGDHMDIFMYRGDTPFCSEECRQEQIDIDEAREKKLVMKSASTSQAHEYSIRTSTVAAA